MPSALATAFVRLRADDSKLKRDISDLRGSLANQMIETGKRSGRWFTRGFGKGIEGIKMLALPALKTAALFGAAGAAGAAALAPMVNAASDAQETMAKFESVFGDLTEEADKFAKSFASSVGRSVHEVRGQLAGFQDLFVPLGFGADEAFKLSQRLTKLTADLAAFNNESEPETQQALLSALVGNHEAVRRYGVVISQSRLEQELMNANLAESVKEASELEKVQARLNLILRGTAAAHGTAKEEAGSFAGQMRETKALLHDTSVEIGKALIPALEDLLKALNELPIKERTAEWAKKFGFLAENWNIQWRFMKEGAKLRLLETAEAMVGFQRKAMEVAGQTVGGFIGAFTALRDNVQGIFRGMMAGVQSLMAKTTASILDALGKDEQAEMFRSIGDVTKGIAQRDAVNIGADIAKSIAEGSEAFGKQFSAKAGPVEGALQAAAAGSRGRLLDLTKEMAQSMAELEEQGKEQQQEPKPARAPKPKAGEDEKKAEKKAEKEAKEKAGRMTVDAGLRAEFVGITALNRRIQESLRADPEHRLNRKQVELLKQLLKESQEQTRTAKSSKNNNGGGALGPPE